MLLSITACILGVFVCAVAAHVRTITNRAAMHFKLSVFGFLIRSALSLYFHIRTLYIFVAILCSAELYLLALPLDYVSRGENKAQCHARILLSIVPATWCVALGNANSSNMKLYWFSITNT